MKQLPPLACALALLCCPASGRAQSPENPDVSASAQMLELTVQEQLLLDELAVVETRLLVLHTELQALHIQERELESHLEQLDRKLEQDEDLLQGRREAVSARARALYMQSERGLLQLLFSAQDLRDLLLGGRYLAHVLRDDQEALSALREQRQLTEDLRSERETEWRSLTTRIAQRREMQEEQRELRQRRSSLLLRVRSDRRLLAIDLAEAQLGEPTIDEAVASSEPIAAEPAAEPTTPAELPPAPGLGFANQRGRLLMPLAGDIHGTFGWYTIPGTEERTFRRGIRIEAAVGDPVRASYAGQVRRAEWIRGFGNVIILDHGEGYFTVYAHLDEFGVAVGAMVTSGQIIGTAGDSGSMTGPLLHYEIRSDGQPVDPMEWIALPPGIKVRE